MKKIVLVLAFLFFASIAFSAPTKPPIQTDPLQIIQSGQVFAIPQPPAPSPGECVDYWSTSNVRCSGDIKLFDQCVKTMSGGEWQPKTINCKNYGSGWTCLGTECTKADDDNYPIQLMTLVWALGPFAIIIAIAWTVIKWKQKK